MRIGIGIGIGKMNKRKRREKKRKIDEVDSSISRRLVDENQSKNEENPFPFSLFPFSASSSSSCLDSRLSTLDCGLVEFQVENRSMTMKNEVVRNEKLKNQLDVARPISICQQTNTKCKNIFFSLCSLASLRTRKEKRSDKKNQRRGTKRGEKREIVVKTIDFFSLTSKKTDEDKNSFAKVNCREK